MNIHALVDDFGDNEPYEITLFNVSAVWPDDGYGDNCHHWELADPVRVRLRMPKRVVCGKRRMVTHE